MGRIPKSSLFQDAKIARMIQYLSRQLEVLVAQSNKKCINEWSPCVQKHDTVAAHGSFSVSTTAYLQDRLEIKQAAQASSVPTVAGLRTDLAAQAEAPKPKEPAYDNSSDDSRQFVEI